MLSVVFCLKREFKFKNFWSEKKNDRFKILVYLFKLKVKSNVEYKFIVIYGLIFIFSIFLVVVIISVFVRSVVIGRFRVDLDLIGFVGF